MRRLVLALAFIAGGCGSNSGSTSVCDSLATAASDFSSKVAPCTSTVPTLGFNADACRSSISKCSETDQQKIQDFATCLQALPTCSPATYETWLSSLNTCQAKLGGLYGQGGC